MDSVGGAIVLFASVAMFIYLIYSIGRYDERQKTKALAAEWLRRNPDPAEIHKFIASLAHRK